MFSTLDMVSIVYSVGHTAGVAEEGFKILGVPTKPWGGTSVLGAHPCEAGGGEGVHWFCVA